MDSWACNDFRVVRPGPLELLEFRQTIKSTTNWHIEEGEIRVTHQEFSTIHYANVDYDNDSSMPICEQQSHANPATESPTSHLTPSDE